jgi:hypothetical protein
MKFKAVVEYEYPVEHKLPVKAELILHGDRVVTDNIKPLEQEPVIRDNGVKDELNRAKDELDVDCVSRQAVLDEIDDTNRRGGFGCKLSYTRCRGHIEQLPSVTPQEPKTGHWIDINGIYAECSNCNEEIYITGDFKFCPNCGAKMVELQESEEE